MNEQFNYLRNPGEKTIIVTMVTERIDKERMASRE